MCTSTTASSLSVVREQLEVVNFQSFQGRWPESGFIETRRSRECYLNLKNHLDTKHTKNSSDGTKNTCPLHTNRRKFTQRDIDRHARSDSITRADSGSDFVGSNSCEETSSSLGRCTGLEWNVSYIACGIFSSGTGSSCLARHDERSSAQTDQSFPLVLGSGLWPKPLEQHTVVFLRPAVNISGNSSRRCSNHILFVSKLRGTNNNRQEGRTGRI